MTIFIFSNCRIKVARYCCYVAYTLINTRNLPFPFAVKTVFLLTELEEDASANAVGDSIAEDGDIGFTNVLLFDAPSIDEPASEAGEHIFNVVVSG